jgi:hypothetical protein
VTFTSDPITRHLVLHGTGAAGAGDVDVWFPGASRPSLTTTGLARVRVDAVPGGWRITARPEGPRWSLVAGEAVRP